MTTRSSATFFSKVILSLSLAGGVALLTQNTNEQDVRRLTEVRITGAKSTPAFAALQLAHSIKAVNKKIRQKDSFQLKSGELEPIRIELAQVNIPSPQQNKLIARNSLGYKVGTHLLASLNPDLSHMLEPSISYSGPKLRQKAQAVSRALASSVNPAHFKTLSFADGKKVMFSRGGLTPVGNLGSTFKFDPFASAPSLTGFTKSKAHKLTNIKVKIQLVRGAVYLGQEYQFYLDHYKGRKLIASGKFNEDDFSFTLPVVEEAGELRGELRHLSGAVVAHGRIDLVNKKLDKLTLTMSPSEEQSLVGQVAVQDLTGNDSMPPAEGYTQIQVDALAMGNAESRFYSSFSFGPSQPGSSYLTNFHHAGFESGAGLFESGSYRQVELVPEYIKKRIQTDLGITGSKGWILGQVNEAGRALSQVRVFLAEDPSAEIYYFDGKKWGRSEVGTYNNGLYLIKVEHEALYTLVGNHASKKIASEMVWSNQELTTAINLEAQVSKKSMQIRATNAFTNEDINSRVTTFEQDWFSHSGKGFETSNLPGFVHMSIQAQNAKYQSMSYLASKRSKSLVFPMVNKAWFDEIKKKQNLNGHLALGYFNEDLYQPYIDESPYSKNPTSSYSVVYFNAQGEIVEKPTAFGGFILSHTSRPTSTVVLKPLDSSLNLAQTRLIDSSNGQLAYVSIL